MITEQHRRQVMEAQGSERPLLIKTHTFLPHAQAYVDRLLHLYLAELGVVYLHDALSFCIRELAVNAKKANTKRLYFRLHGLDAGNPDDYALGMEKFKEETLRDRRRYHDLLKQQDLVVKIEFLKYQNTCTVAVKNNVEVLPQELARVKGKIERAFRTEGLEDALDEALDDIEGAGLGILVLVMMLRKLGFTGDFFQFYTLGGETVARIILPLTLD